MSSTFNRRSFLQTAAAGTAALAVPNLASAQNLNSKLNVAFIGVGGRGAGNLQSVVSFADVPVNVVALCDVNARNLAQQAERFPLARTYQDFRKLYDDKTSDIDAVVVSTTEHTHAYATLPALREKKHVYCEKPLTLNVKEARIITQAAADAGVVTQMGTQIHASSNYRRVVELIQSGAIGPVREAHVWVSRAWGLQSEAEARANGDIVTVSARPSEAQTPPDYLDWDLWLGPAPARPYHEVYFPGPKWYRWWDFGNGTMSDLGSHWNDLPFWALELDAPKTIEAFGPPPHPEIAPASMSAIYQYGPRTGSRGPLPAVTLGWYHGTHKPKIWQEKGIPQWDSGVVFIGEEGMLLADYGKHLLLPEEKFADYQRPQPFIADVPGHHEEWLLACANGTPTSSPFSYAGPLTEANHLGNVAFRAGQKIEWNAAEMKIPNAPDAERFLSREPRAGWSLA